MADDDEEYMALKLLREAFPKACLEDIARAYTTAQCDPAVATELLLCQSTNAVRVGYPDALETLAQKETCSNFHSLDANLDVPNSMGKPVFPTEQPMCRDEKMIRQGCPSNGELRKKLSIYRNRKSATKPEDDLVEECPLDLPSDFSLTKKPNKVVSTSTKKNSKKIYASTGSVSSIRGRAQWNGNVSDDPPNAWHMAQTIKQESCGRKQDMKATEDFMLGMLGDSANMDVQLVRDVLDQCNGDAEKCIDYLLDISLPSNGLNPIATSSNKKQDFLFMDKVSTNYGVTHLKNAFPTARLHSSADSCVAAQQSGDARMSIETQNKENSSEAHLLMAALFRPPEPRPEPPVKNTLPSFFTHRCVQKHVIKLEKENDMVFDFNSITTASILRNNMDGENCEGIDWNTHGHWDDFERHRRSANEHLMTMRQYFREAATAFKQGDRERAEKLSMKAKSFRELAAEAKERASERTFYMKKEDDDDNITIDVHDLGKSDAKRLLKVHLNSFKDLDSVQTLTILTGEVSQGEGEGRNLRVREAILEYLRTKGFERIEITPSYMKVNMNRKNGEEQENG